MEFDIYNGNGEFFGRMGRDHSRHGMAVSMAWQSAWHGSQHGIDKHWHLKLRCRPSKRLGQQAKNDKMTSKLTQLCSSLFLNILYISLYSIRDVVQHSNYDILWPYMTIFDPSRRSQTSSSISLPTELSASDGLGIKHISTHSAPGRAVSWWEVAILERPQPLPAVSASKRHYSMRQWQ